MKIYLDAYYIGKYAIDNDTNVYLSTFSGHAIVLYKISPVIRNVYPIISSWHYKYKVISGQILTA